MENSEMKSGGGDGSQCVRVAVNVRPLIGPELDVGCTDCISVVPGDPQVQIGSHAFTFDYVYGGSGSPSSIYTDCVAPLVDALFHGYNATVLAYGQTGSGKTYTMGTNYNGEEKCGGIIPNVMGTIFSRVEEMKDSTEFLIRVSFIEIFKEEVFDLLDPNPSPISRGEGVWVGKPAIPSRVPIQIRETVHGGITLAGVTEAEVRSKEEMASYLSRGSLARATGSTNMNSQSSRSHAIFTISMEQKKVSQHGVSSEDVGDDILCAKLHLVDLAGSERAKRTGADGMRFKEGIHINKGLLALGNVISALGDEKKRKEGGHVPYRDSKLTRLLQDSLGGNSKTVMIACVSPADTNAEETLNTLKYANRARNIQNKAVINRDPMVTQMHKMRSQIEQLQAELQFFRSDANAPFEELQILKHKVSLLEASNSELQRELRVRKTTCEQLSQRAVDAQVEKDKLLLKIESARQGKSWDEIDHNSDQKCDLLKTYVMKIQELEVELLRLQSLSSCKDSGAVDCLDSNNDGLHENAYFTSLHELSCDTNSMDISGEIETEEKELEHTSLQEKLDMELKELDKKLEEKEAEMKRFGNVDTSVLKQHYERKVNELEQEKRALQKEIGQLRHNLANISSSSDDGAQKLKEDYLQKLNGLEAQVAELKKKQDAQAQLLRQKQKSDEAAKRLQDEIQRIKSQKVQLQHKIKQESEQFRLWKASREKEVLQLKKEGRRNEYEMHKLLALNQRQKMVLQRKTEEASMATKRLKDLLESRKASSRDSGFGNGNGPGIQALMQAIEHELEVTVRVHEVRAEYESQKEERARMAMEVAKLKEEADMLRQKNLSNGPQTMSPGARNSRIFALENMLATSSSTLVSMASHLSEAEERERVFSGRGRWNQVRSLAEAKNIMNYLFNLASSSRCMLRDKEVGWREKDSENRDLKEKVVKLGALVRHLEMQKAELIHQTKLQKSTTKNCSMEATHSIDVSTHSEVLEQNIGGHKYLLRNNKGPRSSMVLFEDMDTSESEHSDVEASTDDEWGACCSCSKGSQCMTNKCECRAAGGICGKSCGCVPAKCSNRKTVLIGEPDGLSQPKMADGTVNGLSTSENDESLILASHGAMLLHSAFAEKPAEANDGGGSRRKPLSDIGNTQIKSNAPKPNPRKKWKKSSIQLIPVAPPSSQPENSEAPKEPGNIEASKKLEKGTIEADLPLKLPRAMKSAASNTNHLRERNSDQSDESMAHKEGETLAPRNSVHQARTSDEKENRGI